MQIKFAEDLTTDVKVWVAPDADSKAAIDAHAKAQAAGRRGNAGGEAESATRARAVEGRVRPQMRSTDAETRLGYAEHGLRDLRVCALWTSPHRSSDRAVQTLLHEPGRAARRLAGRLRVQHMLNDLHVRVAEACRCDVSVMFAPAATEGVRRMSQLDRHRHRPPVRPPAAALDRGGDVPARVDDARQGDDRRRSCRSSTARRSSRPTTRSSSTSCSSCTSRTARSTPSSCARSWSSGSCSRRSAAPRTSAAILTTVPSAAHGAHYAGIVREKALLRQLIAASNDILRDAYAPHEQAELVLDKAEKRIFEIAQKKVGGAMVADGGRAARGLRDDRKPRPARRRDRLLRARRHDERPAERRDDHRRGPPVDGQNRVRDEHDRAHLGRQSRCRARSSRWK